jgi:hypothetical protein
MIPRGKLFLYVSMLVAALGVVFSLWSGIQSDHIKAREQAVTQDREERAMKEAADARDQLRQLQSQLASTLEHLRTDQHRSGQTIDESELQKSVSLLIASNKNLEDRISRSEDTISQINRSITDTPDKVLGLPLLKKDLTALQEKSDDDFKQVHADVDRIYDLDKWLIALLGAGVLSGGISNLFGGKKEANKKSAGESSSTSSDN